MQFICYDSSPVLLFTRCVVLIVLMTVGVCIGTLCGVRL